MKKILLIGGAGYVGTELVFFLKDKFKIIVYDLFIYGDHFPITDSIIKVKGDIRDKKLLQKIIKNNNIDTIIHLACISNDPSFDLDPDLGKSINFDPFEDLVKISKDAGVKKFIYASSSSVYGVKKEIDVNENCSLEPITDYSKFKVLCEEILIKYSNTDFCCSIIRPATVCGFSRRQRLDLVVNILTNNAFHKGEITIFGGDQLRPNIHIKDMCAVYDLLLDSNPDKINGKIFNAGYENFEVKKLATIVSENIGKKTNLKFEKTNDNRSYHISSDKIKNELGFINKYSIENAVTDLRDAFINKNFLDPLNNEMYFNIKRMQSINLK
jgi:nucleoside-diphosphate-sugar epimerase